MAGSTTPAAQFLRQGGGMGMKLRIEAMYVGGDEDENTWWLYVFICTVAQRGREIVRSQHDDYDSDFGEEQTSTFGIGVDLWKRRQK